MRRYWQSIVNAKPLIDSGLGGRVSRRSGVLIPCVWLLCGSIIKQDMSPVKWLSAVGGSQLSPSFKRFTLITSVTSKYVSGHVALCLNTMST